MLTPVFEVSVIRYGPDGLAKITSRKQGAIISRRRTLQRAEVEDAVLDEWAELHDALLGYPPNW